MSRSVGVVIWVPSLWSIPPMVQKSPPGSLTEACGGYLLYPFILPIKAHSDPG